jgi:hypothetical protein
MENQPSNAEQALPAEQAAAKEAILAECERLAEAGITFVDVHVDGSGDEAQAKISSAIPLKITFTKKASPGYRLFAPAATL